jgi:hypothetical protein
VSKAEVLTPRDVPLGGPRAMTVRRPLPQRTRSLIGARCFAGLPPLGFARAGAPIGPDDVAVSGPTNTVPPHGTSSTTHRNRSA